MLPVARESLFCVVSSLLRDVCAVTIDAFDAGSTKAVLLFAAYL